MNVVIVEDERVAARRLERLVREILKDKIKSLKVFDTFSECEEHIQKNEIDLLLLDLNLNGENGYNLLKNAVAESFHTIVISANTDRALEAFEYGIVDFVPKPYDKDRLEKSLERFQYMIDGERGTRMLVVKSHGRLQLIPVNEILFFQGAGDYAEIHLRNGGVELHNKSLESLEKLLPSQYVRIHKSYIINMKDVANIHIFGGGKYRVELHCGKSLPLSRSRYKELTDRLSLNL